MKPTNKKPYECPVCEGKGYIDGHSTGSNGWQINHTDYPETCNCCNGTGVVWATPEEAEEE